MLTKCCLLEDAIVCEWVGGWGRVELTAPSARASPCLPRRRERQLTVNPVLASELTTNDHHRGHHIHRPILAHY